MLTCIIYEIYFATTGMFMLNNKKTTKSDQKNQERERERECSYASNYVVEFVIPTSFPFLVFVAFVVVVYT